MSKLDEKIEKYAEDIKSKFGEAADMDLLRKVTRGCGPAIYRDDAETVSATDPEEMARVKNNFLIKKLGCSESDDLDGAITSVVERYGKSNRNKNRAVMYYMLTKHFGKEAVYG